VAVNGRPTRYKKEYAEQAEKLCKLGAIDDDLADFFGVSKQTINAWKKKHPKFLDSLKGGKAYSDDAIVKSLYNKALGYSLTEVKEEDSDTSGAKTTTTTRQVAGDTTAQIFWLKNRQPAQWRANPEGDNSGTDLATALMELAKSLPS